MTSKKWIKKTQSPRSVASEAKAALQSLVKSAKVKPRHKWQDMADLISKGDGIMDATPWGFTVAEPDGSREVEVDGGWTEEHYQFLVPILSQVDEAQLNKAMIARAVLEAKLHGMGVKSQIQGSACLLRSTVSMKKTGYPSRSGPGGYLPSQRKWHKLWRITAGLLHDRTSQKRQSRLGTPTSESSGS